MAKYWFQPKTYGFGATPCSWEGWAATAVFAALVVAGHVAPRLLIDDPRTANLTGWAIFAVLFAGFLWVCTVKGDRVWRWNWGEND